MEQLAESIGEALGTDYYGLREPFTPEQNDYLARTRQFVDNDVLPVINDYWERADVPYSLIEKMGKLGIIGDGIEGYGCPPMDPLSAGLIHMELHRGDGSLGTFLAVRASRVVRDECFRPDLGYRDPVALPAIRAPQEGVSCLERLAALVAF